MKKFTFLLLLIPFLGFTQTYEFENSDDGWNALTEFTATTNATYYTLTTIEGDGTLKNPSFGNESAGIVTSDVVWIGISLKNNDADGPTFMRVSYPKTTTGRVYKNIDITAGNTDYETYWIDLTNSNWTGIMDDIRIHFKAAGNTDYILPTTPVSIDIDKIMFAAMPSTTLQNAYMFDTNDDTEGFTATNGEITGPASGILSFIPVPDKYAKMIQFAHHVDASNKYVHITMKNNSLLNNQLRLVSGGLDGTQTMEISVNDATEHTYTFDFSNEAGWTGDQMFIVGIGSMDDGKAKDDGIAEFDAIVFDNNVGVANAELSEFSLYPNPANDHLFINSPQTISEIAIYDITGKEVLRLENISNNQINISDLKTGVYTLKIFGEHHSYSTEKLVISK